MSSSVKGVEVVTIGETMLMLAPPPYELLEHCDTFQVYNGGAESNVAIALERLGIHAAWISKLVNNALGRKIANPLRAYGVDISQVIWTDTGRIGTFFVEFAPPPRPYTTIYDRKNSVASTLRAEELDWSFIAKAKWLHMTGITPGLSPTCRKTTVEVLKRAKEEFHLTTSFDLNYRSLLWSEEEARKAFTEILSQKSVDVLISTRSDAQLLINDHLSLENTLHTLQDTFECSVVVITLGSDGAIALNGQIYKSPGYPLSEVNRLGAGDAFVAGFIYGYTRGDVQIGLDYGCAVAALKHTIPQNLALIQKEAVENLIRGINRKVIR